MRYLAFLIVIFFSLSSFGQWYYGSGEAVNLENDIGYKKNAQKIKSGVTVDPKSVAVSGGAGSLILKTDGSLYVKQDGGSSTNWRKLLDDTFNVITALGYTPENVANKSTNTSLGTSDTLYPSQNAVKSYVDAQVKDLAAVAPIVITQDATTATISVDLSSKEDTANKSATTTLGTSDVLFPTQNAVKTYVDTAISAIPPQKALAGSAPISVVSDATTSTITLNQSDLVHKGIEETISASKTFSAYINIGDPTIDESYRFYKSGGALIYQKRVSGSWSEVYRVE